jgi:hypothetical protein
MVFVSLFSLTSSFALFFTSFSFPSYYYILYSYSYIIKSKKKIRDGERYACRIANKVISQRIRTIKEQNAKIEIHNDIIKKQNAKIETLEEEVKEVANEKYY